MPFMKGRAPIRRTLQYLQKGNIILRDEVQIMTFNYASRGDHHDGLRNFCFWHIPQVQYNNPLTQLLTFKNITPSPFIQAYLGKEKVLIDCYDRTRVEIHDHIKQVLGKTKEQLEREEFARLKQENPANFGPKTPRYCLCEVPGQVPCPSWTPLPQEMRGKWKNQMFEAGERDSRY